MEVYPESTTSITKCIVEYLQTVVELGIIYIYYKMQ